MNERLHVVRDDPSDQWLSNFLIEGPGNIANRQLYYHYARDPATGEPFPEMESVARDILGSLGVASTAHLLDIGCSYPYYLEGWRLEDLEHKRTLTGLDPYPEQFRGLPYTAPYRLFGKWIYPKIEGDTENEFGIELMKGGANDIPLADNSVDVVSANLVLSLIGDLPGAFKEVQRVMKDAGLFTSILRGVDNKQLMGEEREYIAEHVSDLTGQLVMPPPGVNTRFTSNKARDVLPLHFPYVYEFPQKGPIILDDEKAITVKHFAHLSELSAYRTESGEVPDLQHFEEAVRLITNRQISQVVRRGEPQIDTYDESLFVCSNHPIDKTKTDFELGDLSFAA